MKLASRCVTCDQRAAPYFVRCLANLRNETVAQSNKQVVQPLLKPTVPHHGYHDVSLHKPRTP